MKFEDSYFEDEVRDGFYIPSMVKRAWAAELEVLSEIDRICKKYDIPYFADWGSLLGAVRHGGFIPWDDDMDISMKRADYNRFMEVARQELPEGFDVYNYRENENYWNFVTRVVAKRRICFEEERLKKFHGFPYIVGVDIFLLDYVSRDEEKEQQRVTICNYILAIADGMADGKITGAAAEEGLCKIEGICGIRIDRNQSMNQLRVQLYDQVVKLFDLFSEAESDYLTRMMPNGLEGKKNMRLPKKYYEDVFWMPFENTSIPVPTAYDEMLTRRYGDYMKIVKDAGGHDYPFFESQKQQLQSVLDFDIPHYTFSMDELTKNPVGKEKSLKAISREYQKNSVRMLKDLEEKTNIANPRMNVQQSLDLIVESQQYAIDFAKMVEQCKGENTETVCRLEEFCEEIYQLYEMISGNADTEKERIVKVGQGLTRLENVVNQVCDCIEKEIITRKEIVFLPFKASYWNAMDSVYQAALQDKDCDVYVIPIPYYYKEYDGVFYNMQYEADQFPADVQITHYDEYDFSLHQPERMIIQNPYDEWNGAISVPKFFYSRNLKKYTNQLVYIPYFRVDEFSKNNDREYYNMSNYCNMPGVVHVDRVVVQSENMRNLYIQKLIEFAGKETKNIWEAKIVGIDSLEKDSLGTNSHITSRNIPEKWRKYIYSADGTKKKVILFHIEASSLIQYQEHFVYKVKNVLKVFNAHQENIALIWSEDDKITQVLQKTDETLVRGYEQMVEKYQNDDWGIFLDEESQVLQAIKVADAYYGDAGRVARKFKQAGKTIMLMDYEL